MLSCYCQPSSSAIFRQYGVSQSECKIDRPRPGLSRLVLTQKPWERGCVYITTTGLQKPIPYDYIISYEDAGSIRFGSCVATQATRYNVNIALIAPL